MRRKTVCLSWHGEETLCRRERDDARPAGEYSSETHAPRPQDVCPMCWSVLRQEMRPIGAWS